MSSEPFSFHIVFSLKPNQKWWTLVNYVDFQYSQQDFIAEVMKRSGSFYDLTTWLMNYPSHWADFVNTFDIEYKEK
jgi:hypothetical protein